MRAHPAVARAHDLGGAAPEAAWEERVQRAAHPLAYPALRSARNRPVVRVPRIGVVVSDAALAREVLLDLDHFSKVGPGAPSDLWTPVLGPSVLLNMEGAEHAALRRALGPLFSPRAVRELVAADDGDAGVLPDLTRRLAAGEAVDLAAVVGAQAGAVICGMVGLPPTDEAVRSSMAAAQTITGMVRLHRHGLTRSQVVRARTVLERLTAPARIAYRAGDPATVPGRMRDLGLSEREAMGAVGAFVLTGTETIQSFVPRLVAIAHDAGWTARLLADDAPLRRRAVEEGLRVTVPTPAMLRSVRAGTSVGGVPVAAGDRVVIATVNCCRAGGGFDPDRSVDPAVRHLWFGAGPHFCLGMPLAMAQVDAVLDALAAAASDGRVPVVGGRRAARGVLVPAYRSLELRLGDPGRAPVRSAARVAS
ncbi:cytochrome P450 [Promicromonospora iranensis]|uniref:Cytochrome P450 n=1 Tax=Promicromonospora iranensis TaxID=1105144 RepID=A0ABU2CSI3_9MICO|nr:cytochrome P450 [Promicromonospora iranensis]MDR7384289.1 cytochrome P450 [Promicromonospora iranensis]